MNRAVAVLALAGVALTSPPAGADPLHQIQAGCEHATHAIPNRSDGVTYLVAYAAAVVPEPAIVTGVRCVVKNPFTLDVVYDTEFVTAGPAAVLVDSYPNRLAALEVCYQAVARWSTGFVLTTELTCRSPV